MAIAMVSRVVATGLWMKGEEMLMLLLFGTEGNKGRGLRPDHIQPM